MHFTRNLKIMKSINLKLISEEQFDRVYTFYIEKIASYTIKTGFFFYFLEMLRKKWKST